MSDQLELIILMIEKGAVSDVRHSMAASDPNVVRFLDAYAKTELPGTNIPP
jgi:hypothetical protein